MAVKKKKEEALGFEKIEIAKPKPKLPTKLYKLETDVFIGDILVKKGAKIPLTEKGAKHFKSKFYIK